MSIICQDCCGDGLHHYDEDAFELVHDDPCPSCQGTGVNDESGKQYNRDEVFALTNRSHSAPVYMGEARDEFEDMEIRFRADYYPESYGARELGTGQQLEPDEPAGYEFGRFFMEVNCSWYEIDPEKEHSGMYKTLLDYFEVQEEL